MSNDVHQPHIHTPVATSPSKPGIVKTAAKHIVALGLSTAAAIGAVGCSTDNNGMSDAQSCDMAEQAEPVKSSIHKFTYQSEYMFNPVEGIKVNLDIDVGGITNKMKQACGGQPQLQLYGTIDRDHGGGNNILKEPGVLLSTKEIVTNGRQHLEVSFDRPQQGSKTPYVIGVEDFEIRITGPGGNPVFQKITAEPEQHFDSSWGPDTQYDDAP